MKNRKIIKRTLYILISLMFLSVSVNWSGCGPDCMQIYTWTLSELEKKAYDAEPGEHCAGDIVVDLVTPTEEDYLDTDCFSRISAAVKSNKNQYPFDINMNSCTFKLDYIHEVPAGAFKDCSNLNALTLPYQITDIGAGAFENCSSLEYLNGNIRYIAPDALNGTMVDYENFEFGYIITLSEFESGIIPADEDNEYIRNVTVTFKANGSEDLLGDDCFERAGEVLRRTGYTGKNIDLVFLGNIYKDDEDISEIPERAFENCRNLNEIYLPGSIKYIGSEAFKNCFDLSWMYIGNSNVKAGKLNCEVEKDAFDGCPLRDYFIQYFIQ